jgi:hypothetical protein
MTKYYPLEKEEQKLFVDYVKFYHPHIKIVSSGNGMYLGNSKDTGKYLEEQKELGLEVGFPDLMLLAKTKNEKHDVLFIEMKREKGAYPKLSEAQKENIQWLDENDYCVAIAYGHQQAITVLNNYLKME